MLAVWLSLNSSLLQLLYLRVLVIENQLQVLQLFAKILHFRVREGIKELHCILFIEVIVDLWEWKHGSLYQGNTRIKARISMFAVAFLFPLHHLSHLPLSQSCHFHLSLPSRDKMQTEEHFNLRLPESHHLKFAAAHRPADSAVAVAGLHWFAAAAAAVAELAVAVVAVVK